jgi:3-hydroxyisobutyrate dehydrogenase
MAGRCGIETSGNVGRPRAAAGEDVRFVQAAIVASAARRQLRSIRRIGIEAPYRAAGPHGVRCIIGAAHCATPAIVAGDASQPGSNVKSQHPSVGEDAPAAAAPIDIALVGYGEVGRIFGRALAKAGSVRAYDVLVDDGSWAERARARASEDGVVLAASTKAAVANAGLVVSAVTAEVAAQAAQQIAAALHGGAFVLDVNSASPATKAACADVIADAGGCYVEAAVMSSVPPHGIRVPMLIGGPHAHAIAKLLDALGFAASVGATTYGVVSAIKLCRSVVVKGMEALAVESLLAARRYGVEREVLASLAETFPGLDWQTQASWFWRRVVQHGRRRAEEMREAAATVRDGGIVPRMATATAETQAWMAALAGEATFADAPLDDWRALADRIPRSA